MYMYVHMYFALVATVSKKLQKSDINIHKIFSQQVGLLDQYNINYHYCFFISFLFRLTKPFSCYFINNFFVCTKRELFSNNDKKKILY